MKHKDFQVQGHSFLTNRIAYPLFVPVITLSILIAPATASAGIFSFFSSSAQADSVPPVQSTVILNSQKMPLLGQGVGPIASISSDTTATDMAIGNKQIVPSMGPLGTASDVTDIPDISVGISFYTVHAGDTISDVAKMYGVSAATIRAANGLSAGSPLKAGTVLVILPVSGIQYTVKKGDTIAGIAKKFKADASDITFYNDLSGDADLVVGGTIIVPDATFDTTSDSVPKKPTTPKTSKNSKSASKAGAAPVVNLDGLVVGNNNGKSTEPITVHPLKDTDKVDLGNEILRPVSISSSRRSQGAHGWNRTAVDLAAPLGTPIVAPYDGTVLLARNNGYNDGYGKYVIIMSTIDGYPVQFILAHMSKILVTAGQQVSRGDTIGLVGMTGDATGDHLHFEVRGALNPLTRNSSYTGE